MTEITETFTDENTIIRCIKHCFYETKKLKYFLCFIFMAYFSICYLVAILFSAFNSSDKR